MTGGKIKGMCEWQNGNPEQTYLGCKENSYFTTSPFILMLLNEIEENTKSMRLMLKDISSVAKDCRAIKLLTI